MRAPYTIDSVIEMADGLFVRIGDAIPFLRPGDGWSDPGQWYRFNGFADVDGSTFILIEPECGVLGRRAEDGSSCLVPYDETTSVVDPEDENSGLAHAIAILLQDEDAIAPRIRASLDRLSSEGVTGAFD